MFCDIAVGLSVDTLAGNREIVRSGKFLEGRRQSNGDPTKRSATSSFASDDLGRKGAPLRQCGRAALLVDLPGDEMPFLIEMIVELGVN